MCDDSGTLAANRAFFHCNQMISGIVVACITGLLFIFLNKISFKNYAFLITIFIVLIALIGIIVFSLNQFKNDFIPMVFTLIAVAILILVNMMVFVYLNNPIVYEKPRFIVGVSSFFLAALMNFQIFAAMQ